MAVRSGLLVTLPFAAKTIVNSTNNFFLLEGGEATPRRVEKPGRQTALS